MQLQDSRQFVAKLDELPPEVEYYLLSDELLKNLAELDAKYNIANDYFTDLITYLIIGKISLFDIPKRIQLDLDRSAEEANTMAIDFIGRIMLPLDVALPKMNTKKTFSQMGGNPDLYKSYTEEFIMIVENENNNIIEEMVKIYEDTIDIKSEFQSSENLFRNSVVSILKSNNYENKARLNNSIIMLLNIDEKYKMELENALYGNVQRLTKEEIIVSGKIVEPTVAHWIEDFIKRQGTDMFDSIVISKYVTDSENAKNITPEERKLLIKLLTLYRNLKFFPESLNNVPIESWEIVPTELKKAEPITTRGDVLQKLYEKPPVEEKKPSVKDNYTADQILDAYRGDAAKEAKVSGFVEDMKKKFGQDKKAMRDEFFNAVRNGDADKTKAALRILAEMGYIENILKEDEKLNKFLAATWEKVHGKEVAQEFRKDPGTPKFMKMFLQYVLEERLKMKKGDAARVGAQIGSMYKKLGKPEYSKLAYFDMGAKEFRWL